MASTRIKLDTQTIGAIARRVVEILEQRGLQNQMLVDAAELARRFGIERSWVYSHAIELGAVKLGSGAKPRLRFDPQIAARALQQVGERSAADPPARSGKRAGHPSASGGSGVPLLPIYRRGEKVRPPRLRKRMARKATGQVVERSRRGGRTFALRFHAYGKRRYLSLGTAAQGWTRPKAEDELANVLADVRRGIWKPKRSAEAVEGTPAPTFHEFASEWLVTRRHEFAARTVEDYELALTHHLLPFFKDHRLPEITAQEADRYKATKVREREQGLVKQPLSNRTINKTLTRLGQILDAAVRYDLIEHNPVKTKVEKLKEAEPKRTRLTGEQVQALLRAAGPHRTLLLPRLWPEGSALPS